MKFNIVILFALLTTMVSCKDVVNVNIVDEEITGKLSYKLIDDEGKGLSGVKVKLYNMKNETSPNAPTLDRLVAVAYTNQDGIVYFEELIPDIYSFTADSAIVNGDRYRLQDYAQIVGGVERKKIVKVSDFSGVFNIGVEGKGKVGRNLGVAVFPANTIPTHTGSLAELIKKTKFKGVTDENGKVSIRVPSDIAVQFVVYDLSYSNFAPNSTNSSVKKDRRYSTTLYYSF